jgi:hypothetical protein
MSENDDNLRRPVDRLKIAVPLWAIERSIVAVYLVANAELKDLTKDHAELLNIPPNKEFFKMVTKHVNAYLQQDIRPPADIENGIMKIIEDMRSEKPGFISMEDYIKFQERLRRGDEV